MTKRRRDPSLHANIRSAGEGVRHADKYTAPAQPSAEDEVADFLWGLTRILHPDAVLEFGTAFGHTSARIATALRANGHGRLVTVELQESRFNQAARLFRRQRLTEFVTQVLGSYADVSLAEFAPFDLVFCDASRHERALEFARAEPFMRAGAWVAFHDVGTNHRGVAAPILELEAQGRVKLLEVKTPRGLLIGSIP